MQTNCVRWKEVNKRWKIFFIVYNLIFLLFIILFFKFYNEHLFFILKIEKNILTEKRKVGKGNEQFLKENELPLHPKS